MQEDFSLLRICLRKIWAFNSVEFKNCCIHSEQKNVSNVIQFSTNNNNEKPC